MKLCWDNIENIRLTRNGNFRDIVKKKTYYILICKECENGFLGESKKSIYCCKSCKNKDIQTNRKCSLETRKKLSKANSGKNNGMYGKKHTEKTKQKWSKMKKGSGNPFYGKQHTEEYKQKMSIKNSLENNSNWKGGYSKKGIPIFGTYAHQIEWCEKVRRNENDPNILEVKCFKCRKWFIPKLQSIIHRLQILKGNSNYRGEYNFYCSDQCKNSCSIYGKAPEVLMKEDAVRAGRLSWMELGREAQPELRQMVLTRDNSKCVKCGETNNLQCHHILPVNIEPLLSADINNCITLCKECHKEAHRKDGCNYSQLHMEEC